MKLIKYKKSISMLSIIIGAVAVAIFLYIFGKPLIAASLAHLNWTSSYVSTESDYTNSYLFEALSVGFLDSKGIPTDDPSKIADKPCTGSGSSYTCPKGAYVHLYVIIKNTGDKMRTLYASPWIDLKCKADSSCDNEVTLQGVKACLIEPGKPFNCPVDYPRLLPVSGTYKIYPKAVCLSTDCYNSASPDGNNVYSFNKNSYITIVVP